MKWFKHFSTANLDAKLQEVILDYGAEGYGMYWYCIELIAHSVSPTNLTFELEHDARLIARNLGSTVKKTEEIMRKFVQLGLFEAETGSITCLKLATMSDEYMERAIRMNYKSKKNQKLGSCPDNVPTVSGESRPRIEENRIEENRREEEEKRREEPLCISPTQPEPSIPARKRAPKKFTPPTVGEVLAYMAERGADSKEEANKFFDYWESVGWTRGRTKMKDWKASVRTWLRNADQFKPAGNNGYKTAKEALHEKNRRECDEWARGSNGGQTIEVDYARIG